MFQIKQRHRHFYCEGSIELEREGIAQEMGGMVRHHAKIAFGKH